jgi:hypothetical protein
MDSPLDSDLVYLNKWVAFQSDVLIECNRLESGYTESVDGQIQISKGPKMASSSVVEGILLYKITENGPQYFSKGNVL